MPNTAALIDLNTASRAELDSLPGVTEALADAIIAARPFRAVGDLSNVAGLTPEVVAGIVPHVIVRRTPSALRPPKRGGSIPPPPNYSIKSPYSRRLYSIPVRTRYQFMAGAVYGVIGVLLLTGAAWLYFNWSTVNTPVAAVTPSALPEAATLTSTLEATATEVATQTSGLSSALPPLATTAAPTQAASETTAPTFTATAEPAATLTPTETPSLTSTATLTPSPTLTFTRRPTSTLPPTRTPFPTRTLTATPTLSPTPTATATFPPFTPPANVGILLFAEQFNPPRYRWVTRQLDPINSEIGEGVLTLGVRRAVVGYSYSDAGPAADVYYQATARVQACAPEDHYGLQVRLVDENNFYLFGVTCAGGVRVQMNQAGRYRFLAETPPNPAINLGPNAENVLAVRAVGSSFTFIVNGATVLTLNEAALGEGRFGVYARSIVSPQLTVTFDEVAGWRVTE